MNKRKSLANTPRRPPLATNMDYQSHNLNKRRDAVLKEIGDSVPEVSTEFFLESFLPHIPSGDIDMVERKLKQGHHLKPDGWKSFPEAPSGMTEREDSVFAPLNSIWDSVVKFGQKVLGRSPTLDLHQYPHRTPVSDRDDLARPDGQCALADVETIQMLKKLGLAYSHYSNVVLWELKKDSTEEDVFDNIRKVVWGCHQTLLTDPRRRFVIGITIEDTDVRAWYFSRTYIVATEGFDFFANPRTFIHFIMALAFATPEELGFDTTVSLCAEPEPENPESQVIQFKMRVNDKNYVTCGPLCDFSADSIRGRAIRVWMVKEEDNPDRCCVVKDVWVHRDALSEGAQLERLYGLLKNITVTSDGRKPTDYFLSVVAGEFVKVEDGREDDTSVVMMRDRDLPATAGYVRLIPHVPRPTKGRPSRPSRPTPMRGSGTLTQRSRPTGVPGPAPVRIQPHTRYRPRKHYRIVFEEVGMTLYQVPSLSELLRVLADATTGLEILHERKLAHRDVSPGNIIVLNGVGKLSDLEYMKPFGGDEVNQADLEGIVVQPNEHKTGSQQFTAVEVQMSRYMYFFDPTVVFSFNPLHDLESILWILLWTIMHHTAGDHDLLPKQHIFAIELFQQDQPQSSRHDMIRLPNSLLLTDFPKDFRYAVEAANTIGSVLREEYTRFEAALAADPPASESTHDFNVVHQTLIDTLRDAADRTKEGLLLYTGKYSESEEEYDSESEEEQPVKRFKACAGSDGTDE
ncbi:hypothetical protein C8R47DRAFT_730019 [Mycena vitilis]|nr:hypothetical protein C8R47DRAFT_730019 [Mycena vitilis]